MNKVFDLGYVKLRRDIMNRPWYGDNNALRLYVELLLRAVFTDTETDGVQLKKGQAIVSIHALGEICQQSYQQTRTALNKLKAANDITITPTPKYSIVTLNMLADTEEDNKVVSKPVNKQSNKANNAPSIYNKKEKEREERKEEGKSAREPSLFGKDGKLDTQALYRKVMAGYGKKL